MTSRSNLYKETIEKDKREENANDGFHTLLIQTLHDILPDVNMTFTIMPNFSQKHLDKRCNNIIKSCICE